MGQKPRKDFYRIQKSEVAPFCPVTGASCLLAPAENLPSNSSPLTSEHHARHSSARLLRMKLLGRTERTSRLQRVFNTQHNKGPKAYHNFYKESYDSRTRIGRCGLILFNVALAVPDQVIDTQGGIVRPITHEERERFFTSNEISIQSEFMVRRFFTALVLDSAEHHASKSALRSYRAAHDERRESIGNDIIGKLLPFALKELNNTYSKALDLGILPASSPGSPAEVARQYVFREETRFAMLDDVVTTGGQNLWLPIHPNGRPMTEAA